MIVDTLNKKIQEAMKSGDKLRASTLKLLSSELHNAKIDKRGDLDKEEEIAVVQKEIKKRKDAIEAYDKGGAKERAKREKEELNILEEYMPDQLSDQELGEMVDESIKEVGAKEVSDMGKVIGKVMDKVKGRAEGKRVSEMVKGRLS